MYKLIIALVIYLVIGLVIAISPFYYLRSIDKRIKDDNYNNLEVYDLLLFNTVMDVSGRPIKIAIFISIMLFYPVLLIKTLIKKFKNYRKLRKNKNIRKQ